MELYIALTLGPHKSHPILWFTLMTWKTHLWSPPGNILIPSEECLASCKLFSFTTYPLFTKKKSSNQNADGSQGGSFHGAWPLWCASKLSLSHGGVHWVLVNCDFC